MKKLMRGTAGFTLIELMIVVSIIAILAGIGLPLYTKYVFRGKQVEAKSLLMTIKVEQEQFFAENGCYTTLFDVNPPPLPQALKSAQAGSYFDVAGVTIAGDASAPCDAAAGAGFANDYQVTVSGLLASGHPNDLWGTSDRIPGPVHCDTRWPGGSNEALACRGATTAEREY